MYAHKLFLEGSVRNWELWLCPKSGNHAKQKSCWVFSVHLLMLNNTFKNQDIIIMHVNSASYLFKSILKKGMPSHENICYWCQQEKARSRSREEEKSPGKLLGNLLRGVGTSVFTQQTVEGRSEGFTPSRHDQMQPQPQHLQFPPFLSNTWSSGDIY